MISPKNQSQSRPMYSVQSVADLSKRHSGNMSVSAASMFGILWQRWSFQRKFSRSCLLQERPKRRSQASPPRREMYLIHALSLKMTRYHLISITRARKKCRARQKYITMLMHITMPMHRAMLMHITMLIHRAILMHITMLKYRARQMMRRMRQP